MTPSRPSTRSASGAGTFALGGELVVNRIGYGTLQLTGRHASGRHFGPPADRRAAERLLRRAVELGVTLLDTADSYGPFVAEELIASALHPYPEQLVIATKGGMVRSSADDLHANGHPEHLRRACEASLRRLRVDRIALYQLHTPDERVPLEDSVGAIADLQREGKIHRVGVSNVSAEELARARTIVEVVSVQNRYNLADRSSDEVLAACAQASIAFIPWYPLDTGRLAAGDDALRVRIARRHDATPAQIALAWLLARSPVMLPIPGTSSMQHLRENVAAGSLSLSEAELRELDAANVK